MEVVLWDAESASRFLSAFGNRGLVFSNASRLVSALEVGGALGFGRIVHLVGLLFVGRFDQLILVSAKFR